MIPLCTNGSSHVTLIAVALMGDTEMLTGELGAVEENQQIHYKIDIKAFNS